MFVAGCTVDLFVRAAFSKSLVFSAAVQRVRAHRICIRYGVLVGVLPWDINFVGVYNTHTFTLRII